MVEVITDLLSQTTRLALAKKMPNLSLRVHLFQGYTGEKGTSVRQRLVGVVCEPHHTSAMAIAVVGKIDGELANRLAVSLDIRMCGSMLEVHDVSPVLNNRILEAINSQIRAS